MEPYLKNNFSDITYVSELTPTPIFVSVGGWLNRGGNRCQLRGLELSAISKIGVGV